MISVRTSSGEENIELEEFEARIRLGQISPSTQVRFSVLTGDRWVDARELEVFRRLYVPARVHFTRSFTLGAFPFVTAGLCVLQIVIYFGVAGLHRTVALDPLLAAGAKIQPNILELGETWRLLTANILHRDVLHLLFNMFFLFNLGGAIENAFRLRDYAFVLVTSSLGTTLLSTWMSPHPSVGASGIVLGLFGSASVFGYKYSEILPSKYRRYFGTAVLPYALFILYVGLATDSTDNWGHLGGMLGGLAATIPLRPKLLWLGDGGASLAARHGAWIASAVMLAATLAVGPIIRVRGPVLVEDVGTDTGIVVAYPTRWREGENHLGLIARGNTLGTGIGMTAEKDTRRPFDLNELRRRFVDDIVGAGERDGTIASVEIRDEKPFLIEGGRAIDLRIDLESRAGPLETRNILIERGHYAYTIVLSVPRAFARAYEPVLQAMVARIRLVEPAGLENARRRVTTFPGMSSAHVDLGDELAMIGDLRGAAASYQHALGAIPDLPEALFGLARLAANHRGDLVTAERIARDLHQGHREEPAFALLLADLRQRLGEIDGACTVLQETLETMADPSDELRDRLLTLRCRTAELGIGR